MTYRRLLMSSVFSKVRRKIEYIHNKKATYDYAPQQGGWEKYGSPVFGDETTASVFDPFVVMIEDRYRLFVSERKNSGIICTDSTDGTEWEKWKVALEAGDKGSWEERVNRASVCKIDGKWLMWYTGQSRNNSAIGIATSDDGIRFTRMQQKPILVPSEPYEKGSVMNPCVLWDKDEKIFKMWYAAGEQFEPDVLCYAESKDGINWERYANNPILEKSNEKYDQCKVGGCDILKENDRYYMFYIGYQNVDTARVCMAESNDGIHNWVRSMDNPVSSPEKKSWDADAVYKPTVVLNKQKNKLLMWYNGRKQNCERIGLAEYRIK